MKTVAARAVGFDSLAAHSDVIVGVLFGFAMMSVREVIGRLPSENPASDYTGRWPRLVKGWLEKHRAGKPRDHPQQLSSGH